MDWMGEAAVVLIVIGIGCGLVLWWLNRNDNSLVRYLLDTLFAWMILNQGVNLRDHPLMCYRSIPNWPPVWICGTFNERLTGEIGVLKRAMCHENLRNRCFLVIEYANRFCTGCLLFDDATFCKQINELLQFYIGSSIRDIGSIDLAYTA